MENIEWIRDDDEVGKYLKKWDKDKVKREMTKV